MHILRARRVPVLAWLLAGLFLLSQGAALAHEYEHVLHKHEAPCAQHFFASGLDIASAVHAVPAAVPTAVTAVVWSRTSNPRPQPAAAYAVRAPPVA